MTAGISEEVATILELLHSFKAYLTQEPLGVDSENWARLVVALPSKLSLDDFSGKLQSISRLYQEICALAKISLKDYPPRVVKIESGSFWVEFFGHEAVIAVLLSILTSAATYFYQKYSATGKIQRISKKAESLDSVIGHYAKLSEQKIDVKEMAEYLRKSAVVIAEELNHLLIGEPSVRLNDKVHSIPEPHSADYLTEGERIKLLVAGKGNSAENEEAH